MTKRIPDDFLTCPSRIVDDFSNYLNHSAIRYIPQFSLQSSINYFGHLFGRNVRTETGLMTGMYSLLIGGSGVGKGYCKQSLNSIDTLNTSIISSVTSEAAIRSAFVIKSPNLMIIMDELGDKLASKSDNDIQSKAAFRELFNESIWRFKSYSAFKGGEVDLSQKQYDIHYPCLNLLGFSTPEQLIKGLTDSDVESGTLNRFTIVDAKIDEVVRNEFTVVPDPSNELLNQICSLSKLPSNREENDYKNKPLFKDLCFDEGVLNWFHDKHDSLMLGKNARYNVRTVEKAMKLSAIFSFADRLKSIPSEYAKWCFDYESFYAYNTKKLSESVGVSGYSDLVSKFLLKLKSAGDTGIEFTKLNNFTRRTLSMKPYERDQMIEDLRNDSIIDFVDNRIDIKDGRKKKYMFYIGDNKK